MNTHNPIISTYQSFHTYVEDKELLTVLDEIKGGKYKEMIEECRYAHHSEKLTQYDQLKKKLPAFTTSGHFKPGHAPTKERLVDYSGFIILDIDKLAVNDLVNIKQKAQQLHFTYACFISPSGVGLKIIINTHASPSTHEATFHELARYYEKQLGVEIDPSGKNVNRLCFYSYDPATYINSASHQFPAIEHFLGSYGIEEAKKEVVNATVNSRVNKTVNHAVNQPSNYSNSSVNLPINYSKSTGTTDTYPLYQETKQFTNHKKTYHEGNRHNYLLLLACNCNRKGISEDNTLHYLLSDPDFQDYEDKKDIMRMVQDTYLKNSHEFEAFASKQAVNSLVNKSVNNDLKSTDSQEKKNQVALTNEKIVSNSVNIRKQEKVNSLVYPSLNKDQVLENTPTIPDIVYQNLSDLFKQIIQPFQSQRDKDTLLTSSLAILSGCLPHVQGVYAKKTVYPNLFNFILAPSANGKAGIDSAKALGNDYHTKLLTKSREAKQAYESELEEYNRLKKKDPSTSIPPPQEPNLQILYIPANASSAAVMGLLEMNQGKGIICETEADTMGNSFKSDWGGYSDLLRKSFHHESLSSARKKDNEFVQIDEPKLSVVLAGTVNQVLNIIQSSEDGLFSRFIFYLFKEKDKWKDISPDSSNINLTDYFNRLGEEVTNTIIERLESKQFIDNPIQIHLTQAQWDRLNAFGENYLAELQENKTNTSKDASSIIKRMVLNSYKIIMILTVFRKLEDGEDIRNNHLQAEDVDVNSALALGEVYYEHALLLHHNLPNQQEDLNIQPTEANEKQEQFYQVLPVNKEFSRKEAVSFGGTIQIKERTVDKYLKRLLQTNRLTTTSYGSYQKIVSNKG